MQIGVPILRMMAYTIYKWLRSCVSTFPAASWVRLVGRLEWLHELLRMLCLDGLDFGLFDADVNDYVQHDTNGHRRVLLAAPLSWCLPLAVAQPVFMWLVSLM